MTTSTPLCFVLIPRGIHVTQTGKKINFNAIYNEVIVPAVEKAGMKAVRAGTDPEGRFFPTTELEHLILCDYAVVDITNADADLYYHIGLRQAARAYKTVLIFNQSTRPSFNLELMPNTPYDVNDPGAPNNIEKDSSRLTQAILQLKDNQLTDSAQFQILDESKLQDLAHEKTDVFRARVTYSPEIKEKLTQARQHGIDAVRKIETELGDILTVESGIIIDLLLSYRAVKGWKDMISLVERLPEPLANRVMIREQTAFALNRNNQPEKAESLLLEIIKEKGPSSETNSLLGRIYKDLWEKEVNNGNKDQAQIYLNKAIEAYKSGFEADWRDSYPGINAVTLLDINDPTDPRKTELLPIVTYAMKQKMSRGNPDYWDYATLLELSVLSDNPTEAELNLNRCIPAIREKWEPETTARNLRLIRKSREEKGMACSWIIPIETQLMTLSK